MKKAQLTQDRELFHLGEEALCHLPKEVGSISALSVFVVSAQYKFPLPPGYEAIIPTLNDNSRSHDCYHDGQYHRMGMSMCTFCPAAAV